MKNEQKINFHACELSKDITNVWLKKEKIGLIERCLDSFSSEVFLCKIGCEKLNIPNERFTGRTLSDAKKAIINKIIAPKKL